MRQRVVFFQAFYNVARPHMSLRQQLPLQERTGHGAIRPRWRKRTPAMAASLTEHVWTFVSCSRPNSSRWILKVLGMSTQAVRPQEN